MNGASRNVRHAWNAVGTALIALVFYVSLTPNPPELPVQEGDKVGHVLAYATLMFWFAQANVASLRRAGWALGFVAMGIAIEFLQRATGYRSFEIADMVADAAGVALGWGAATPRTPNLLRWLEARRPARRP